MAFYAVLIVTVSWERSFLQTAISYVREINPICLGFSSKLLLLNHNSLFASNFDALVFNSEIFFNNQCSK